MRRKIITIGVGTVILAAGIFCFYLFYLENPSRQILARVNDEKITAEEFNRELVKVEEPLRQMYKEEPFPFLEGIIVKRLLLQEAKKQGISPSAKTYKDVAKDSIPPEEILIVELMKKKFPSPPEVTRKEVESFYSLFKDQMKGKTLNEVAPLIEQMIQEGKQRQRIEQFVKELHNTAKVEIEQGRLKKIAIKPPESNSEEDFKKAIASGKPVVVDFGANSCIPCRQMRPILKEVEKDCSGKAHVLVIDVYKYQGLAREYKIQLIPTLVFLDSKGKEVFRNVGVMSKEMIAAKLKEIGMAS